ncbi:MAG: hypothetical protein Q9227_009499 [Pyrenula ochraceoflavens]
MDGNTGITFSPPLRRWYKQNQNDDDATISPRHAYETYLNKTQRQIAGNRLNEKDAVQEPTMKSPGETEESIGHEQDLAGLKPTDHWSVRDKQQCDSCGTYLGYEWTLKRQKENP